MDEETCEHCGQPIALLDDLQIWIHAISSKMACGAFYTSRARPAR